MTETYIIRLTPEEFEQLIQILLESQTELLSELLDLPF